MTIRIRRLTASDYRSVLDVFTRSGIGPKSRGRDSRTAFVRQVRSRRNVYLGAFDGTQLVGTVLGTHDTRKGWINRLAVLPQYQRRGIASLLVAACESGLRARGMNMFAALIDEDNSTSRALFSKLGYDVSTIYYARKKLDPDI
jgi:N-acetylglutamate synthase